MPQTQTDFELNPDVIDEIVEESGRAWLVWLLTPLAVLAVAGVAFFIIRRLLDNSDM